MLRLGPAIVIAAITAATACAQSDHYAAGSFNIRDFALPPVAGFFGAIYNNGYSTNNLQDASGNRISSITIQGPDGHLSVALKLNVNVNLYALAPVFILGAPKKSAGGEIRSYA